MEHNKKPLVVVVSRVYSTGLGVIRSLGAAGYTVDLVASAYKEGMSKIAASSKYVRNYVEVVSRKVKNGNDMDLLEELYKYADEKEKPVLFPTDDYTTAIVDMNSESLSKYFIMPHIVEGKEGSLTNCMDKTVQGELARKAGLLTPLEWVFNLEEEITIPTEMIYPCFCKPIESVTGYKREMAVCSSEEELLVHLNKLKKKFAHRSVLVQEFLEIDNEIDLSGVCFDQEIIIPAIIKKTNVAQYEKGVTLAGKVVPFEELGDIQEKIVRMMKDFHYVGMFDMELNLVGDKIYFNEVNFRSGGPNYSYLKSGVNLPALFVKGVSGEKYLEDEKSVDSYGKSFIYEKVAWEDYIQGFMTKTELKKCISDADIMLLCDDDDPMPGNLFMNDIKKNAEKRRLKIRAKSVKRSMTRWIRINLFPTLRKIKPYVLRFPQTKKENARKVDAEKPRVLVSGRNYCSNLCMARSLGEAGYEVEVLRIFQVRPKMRNLLKALKPDAYSKYVKGYYICISRRNNQRIVDKLIELADKNRKMLLIPADDLVANIVDDNLEVLSEYYVLPHVNHMQGEINRLMSKGVQKEMALAAGLPVLNSCVIRTERGEFDIPDSITYPCFMKPNISKNSSKSKMKRCDSKQELEDTLREYSQRKDVEMLIEDFVEIGKEYSLLGVSTKEGVLGPGFFGAERGGHKERRGVALIGKILPCSEYQGLIDKLNQFVASLNYEGLFDIDLIETTDGKMYFVELNMRFGASGYAVTQSGVNLPGMYADYMLLNKPLDLSSKVTESGKLFVSEKVMIEEYTKSFLTLSEMKQIMKETDIHFVMNKEDPVPYRHFKKFYLVAAIMRLVYAIKESKESESGS